MAERRRANSRSSAEVRIGNYIIGETLGVGTFGKVKVGIHKSTGLKVAVKIVNRDKIKALDVAGKLRREILNLWLFRHPHIIKLYQVISTPTDIFMIMEYVSGGELFDFIVKSGKLFEKDARKFFQQIISGVAYCHRHKVVHRDLKPENLLLDSNNNVKIADFGLSNIMQDGEFLRTSCGSPNYAAPEVISGKLYAGPEVDVWSCGVILYALLCGTLPFDDEHIPTLFKKIKAGYFYLSETLSISVRDLLKRMIAVDPIKRATIEDIRRHPWFVIDLPNHLFPQERDEDASIIDKEAVFEVCQACNVTEREVFAALLSSDPSDHLCVAYNLIIDNKRFGSTLNPEEVSNFYVATGIDSNSGMFSGSPVPGNLLQLYGGQHPLRSTSPGSSCGSGGYKASLTSPGRPHPERMPDGYPLSRTLDPLEDFSSTRMGTMTTSSDLNAVGQVPLTNQSLNAGAAAAAGMKRFKWHLGIRSQSRPWDIMREVFKAMDKLGYEWKIINPFNIRVRKWNAVLQHHSRLVLQLYQVDAKSYLLDFKCIDDSQQEMANPKARSSVCLDSLAGTNSPTSASPSCNSSSSNNPFLNSTLDEPMTQDENYNSSGAKEAQLPSTGTRRHQNMEFFEMCTELITTLAR